MLCQSNMKLIILLFSVLIGLNLVTSKFSFKMSSINFPYEKAKLLRDMRQFLSDKWENLKKKYLSVFF